MTRRRAFTIVELLVTVVIVAMLVTAAAAGVVRTRQGARDSQRSQDVFAIGTAMDQSATTARGLYPYNATTKTTNVFCADLLGSTTNNPNSLNFGLFLSRSIPKDPVPDRSSGSCVNYRDGYTIHNRYGGGANLARPLSGQNYEYVIEVGLERERAADDQTLTAGTDTSSTKRKQFLLLGKPCTGGIAGTCSLQ